MKGCITCKTNFTARIAGNIVCYYCGGELSEFEHNIPVSEIEQSIIPTPIVMIEDDFHYNYDD
jgi:hypothetical protein